MDQKIQDYLDREEIRNSLYKYCRAMDTNDRKLGYSLWHEKSEVDYGADVFQGSGHAFIDWVIDMHDQSSIARTHNITNVLITLDQDQASSEAYFFSVQRMAAEKPTQYSVWGRYLDSWVRTANGWAISRRTVRTDFDEIREVTAMTEPGRRRSTSD